MGIFVELGYFCISQYVFKNRKVCSLARESVSFFPPRLHLEKRTVRRHLANLLVVKVDWNLVTLSLFVIEFLLNFY